MFEDFPGGVAFEDAGDLAHGFALCEAASHVVAGGLVVFHAGEDDVVERRVGLAVPAPVEPMPGGFARRGGYRGDPTQVSEGGFGADPFGVVAGGDQQFGGGVEPDPEHFQQTGCGVTYEGSEQPVELFGFLSEVLDSLPEGPDGDQGGVAHSVGGSGP